MGRRMISAVIALGAAVAALSSTPVLGDVGLAAEPTLVPQTPTAGTLAADVDASLKEEAGREKYEYQAEVQRLMDILINSLYVSALHGYHNKDIFLRELISNASDALDKIRFLSLADDKLLGEGENRELEIRISFDREKRQLTIRDRGVGMTKADLIQNLGTIAKSGTANFAENLSAGSDSSLIGQFGVGFYSAYLVADRVRVVSKHHDDKQYVWESTADATFTVAEDPRGDTLGRGTEITLFIKEDAVDFLSDSSLRGLIKKYSEFITFPIYLRTVTTEEVDVPIEPTKVADEKPAASEEEEVAAEEETEEEEKPKTRKEKRTVENWELCNDQKAIWHRKSKDVTEEEYKNFYKNIAKDKNDPQNWIHFSAEGEVDFRAILFVPGEVPTDLYDQYYQKSSSLRLYVRKVLISDKFEDLMPRYLNFIKGVVDSDDLPLNVSRENLQQHKILKVIGKKLVRKALEMIRQMALDEKRAKAKAKEAEKKEADAEADADADVEKKEEAPLRADAATAYTDFWKRFSKNIKLGVIEDASNRSKLAKLLRFATSRTAKDELRSLDEYVADMQPGQKNIYYIAAESMDAVVGSPFLERLNAKGLEVLFLVDPIDEYAIQNLPEYDGHRMQSITKENLVLPGDEKLEKKREAAYTSKFKPLATWLKKLYADKVEKVVVSNRLATSPCILVTSQYGYSANMERIMKSQAFNDASRSAFLLSKKTMEINPRHPLIAALNERAEADAEVTDAEAKDIAELMFDTAIMNSGFQLEDPKSFAARMYRLMASDMRLASSELLPEIEVEEDAPADAAQGEDEEDGAEEAEEAEHQDL